MPPSAALPPGWQDLPDDVFGETFWDQFEARFGFQASTKPDRWPAIREPTPSMTLDLSPISDGDAATFVAGVRAVNGLALVSMVEIFGADEQLIVLDWQHPAYLLRPHEFAAADHPWEGVQPFPNGDYYIFLNEEMTEGIFGHPWEQTLCVIGESMTSGLGSRLASWLRVARRDGMPA